jgi:hypothetical protein
LAVLCCALLLGSALLCFALLSFTCAYTSRLVDKLV